MSATCQGCGTTRQLLTLTANGQPVTLCDKCFRKAADRKEPPRRSPQEKKP